MHGAAIRQHAALQSAHEMRRLLPTISGLELSSPSAERRIIVTNRKICDASDDPEAFKASIALTEARKTLRTNTRTSSGLDPARAARDCCM